ncbi:MAG: hypothetical protein WCT16_02015 [Candidatus Buchananbacteria bacterium]
MEIWQREEDLFLIAQALTKMLREAADNGAILCFDPDTIFIDSGRQVVYDTLPTTRIKNIREALHSLGVTLYHVATGKSEINDPTLRAEDARYEPFKSDLWPLVELLLSGQAVSFKQIEELLIRPSRIKKLARKTKPLVNWLCLIIGGLWGLLPLLAAQGQKAINGSVGFINKCLIRQHLARQIKRLKQHWLKICYFIVGVLVVLSCQWYIGLNISYYQIAGSVFFMFVFALFISILLGVFGGAMTADMSSNYDWGLNIGLLTFETVFFVTITVMSFLNPLSYCTRDNKTPDNLICVNRQTGQYCGSLATDVSEGKQFTNTFINPFKYKPAFGLRPECAVVIPLFCATGTPEAGEEIGVATIYYSLSQTYDAASKIWKTDDEVKTAIADCLLRQSQAIKEQVGNEMPLGSELSKKLADLEVSIKDPDGLLSAEEIEAVQDQADCRARNALINLYNGKFQQAAPKIGDLITASLADNFQGLLCQIQITRLQPACQITTGETS